MTVTETKTQPAKGTAGKTAAMEEEELLALNLPMVSLQVHRPHMPHMDTSWAERAMETGRKAMPPPERLIYYGGLGALAVIGAIEWPVAAAIGVGTMLASRARAAARRPAGERMPPERRTSPVTAPKATASKATTRRRKQA
ncbi:hypothetical protein [Acrocarpospora catenulata]|uniref:hypothetical protein n=1 Tax=Acrocarpospora catenulata TaxID=2836182 RepID=UPI001BDB1D32|nr:hypothetical protein [Acrocarpospora catenulata]